MTQPILPRHLHQDHAAWEAKLARILIEVGEPAPSSRTFRAALPGDERTLRGIPAIGRNVAGAIPGTSPHLRNDR